MEDDQRAMIDRLIYGQSNEEKRVTLKRWKDFRDTLPDNGKKIMTKEIKKLRNSMKEKKEKKRKENG